MQKVFWCFFFLVSCSFAAGDAQSITLAKTDKSWDGATLPAYPQEMPEISVLKITIPAHATLPLHKHPIINAGYLLKGTLKVVTDENKTLELKAGEAIVEVVNTWHYGVNEGDEPAEIVVFYAGTKESALAIKR